MNIDLVLCRSVIAVCSQRCGFSDEAIKKFFNALDEFYLEEGFQSTESGVAPTVSCKAEWRFVNGD